MHNKELISPLYTDMYQLTMGQAYFQNGRHEQYACFDYFFRKIPFDGGYVLFAGLSDLLQSLESLHFSDADIDFLHKNGFHEDYLAYLKNFRFRGMLTGFREGDVVFPSEPVIRAEGNLLEVQLIETLLLNLLNFQSLIATKASRIRKSAGGAILSDFGLRRAQGTGGLQASRAAIIGGFNSTSNVYAAHEHDIPPSGTMAHSYVESHDDELEAFRSYANTFPDNCVLVADTYNTMKSGVPNAIQVARELKEKGYHLKGVRLDSGDLAYLSRKTRKMLDDSGFKDVKIVVSNQLDEHVIKSLKEQKAPIDIYGVGTSMIIGRPDGAIDGVYKLAMAGDTPRLKLSENVQKTTLPGKKKVLRYLDNYDRFYADCIALAGEEKPERMTHPIQKEKSLSLKNCNFEELFTGHMDNGEILRTPPGIFELKEFAEHRLEKLPEEHQRFDYPHIYKVGISDKLLQLRETLVYELQHYI